MLILGIKVVVDSKAVMVLVGTEMDFIEDDIKSEFVFKNPNSKGTCGCGESFHLWLFSYQSAIINNTLNIIHLPHTNSYNYCSFKYCKI